MGSRGVGRRVEANDLVVVSDPHDAVAVGLDLDVDAHVAARRKRPAIHGGGDRIDPEDVMPGAIEPNKPDRITSLVIGQVRRCAIS